VSHRTGRPAVRLHLTNVTGTGAVRLAESLLPALIGSPVARVSTVYLPERSALASLACLGQVKASPVRRRLPNALSRFVECVLPSQMMKGEEPLLVLGDLPLRCRARQTLFIQTPHLVSSSSARRWRDKLKFAIARTVLKMNLGRVQAVVVQTSVMRQALAKAYPDMASKLHVVAQPVPSWLMALRSSRTKPTDCMAQGLRLAYPAAGYPHKNHALLSAITEMESPSWPVACLRLTLNADQNPAPHVPWIRPAGALSPEEMVALYADVDALLFLSLEESYGFPLIEAMYVGIPVVCPDRPYARVLCGDGAIYFDPNSLSALKGAVEELHRRLLTGWWPDWQAQLAQLPASWQQVANSLLKLTVGTAVGYEHLIGETP
jgi:hypothetical protein